MLLDELNKANIEALKAHDKSARAVLSIVISRAKLQAIEAQSQNKPFEDKDVVKIIGKVIKELEEELEGYKKVNNQEEVASITNQMKVISAYLPKMMSEEDIRKEIATLEDKSMPFIMKYFKANHDGEVDMSLVSKIAREN